VLSVLLAAVVMTAVLAAPAGAAEAAEAGWQRVELPQAGSYALRYLPPSAAAAVEAGEEVPAVVFLHGAGSVPEHYRAWLRGAADAAGATLILPRSLHPVGWGAAGDEAMVGEAVAAVAATLPLDPDRVSIAGYSAGGAYAYLLAYLGERAWPAVFTLGAPFYEVPALARPERVAPIRMFYGTADPNYAAAYPRLVAQWQRLGVPHEADVHPGLDHGALPEGALADGFGFLLAHALDDAPGGGACVAGETALCLVGGRFRVEVEWATAGSAGAGRVVPVGSDDSGLFWFFDPANWEMLVKVLDACAVNGHRWVFAAATTNVAHTLRVTDTATGADWRHDHPGGAAAPAVTDNLAFDCE
jgi:dienelactone hydrolase